MPRLQKLAGPIYNDPLNLSHFMRRKSLRLGEQHRFEPELRELALPLDVDVWRFVVFIAVEEETIPSDTRDDWHARSISEVIAWLAARDWAGPTSAFFKSSLAMDL
jgi:hypothetical protein